MHMLAITAKAQRLAATPSLPHARGSAAAAAAAATTAAAAAAVAAFLDRGAAAASSYLGGRVGDGAAAAHVVHLERARGGGLLRGGGGSRRRRPLTRGDVVGRGVETELERCVRRDDRELLEVGEYLLVECGRGQGENGTRVGDRKAVTQGTQTTPATPRAPRALGQTLPR